MKSERAQDQLALAAAKANSGGIAWPTLILGIVPNVLGVVLVACGFAWLVHHPHRNRGRYQNTSTFIVNGWLNWPMTVVWLWQNYHSIHHLFPRVPFYRYHRVFGEIRAVMTERGAPIYVLGGASRYSTVNDSARLKGGFTSVPLPAPLCDERHLRRCSFPHCNEASSVSGGQRPTGPSSCSLATSTCDLTPPMMSCSRVTGP